MALILMFNNPVFVYMFFFVVLIDDCAFVCESIVMDMYEFMNDRMILISSALTPRSRTQLLMIKLLVKLKSNMFDTYFSAFFPCTT